jgi:tRNA(fMet)-specific endonuclease VapC
MNGSLLDTNIIVGFLNGEKSIIQRLSGTQDFYAPAVAMGELYYGAKKSAQVQQNIEKIELFASRCTILACDKSTALCYGEIKETLRKQGTPIPENDIWIAAVAIQHDLILATRDAHFEKIPGLIFELW